MAILAKKTMIGLCLIASLGLTACDKIPALGKKTAEVQCNDETSKEKIKQLFLEQIDEKVKIDVNRIMADGTKLDLQNMTQLLSQLHMTISDVRTTSDAKSSKRECEATIQVQMPATMMSEAEESRQQAMALDYDVGIESIAEEILQNNLKFTNNTLIYPIKYSVQRTDDGQTLYATLGDVQTASNFLKHIITDILLKPIHEAEQRAYEAEVEQAEAKASAEEAQQAKIRSEYISVLEKEAKQKLEKLNTDLNLVWNGATAETREELLPEQRIWLEKRRAQCKLEAEASENDVKEVLRLKCEANMTDIRVKELQASIKQIEGG